MSEVIIKAEGLSKSYKISHQERDTYVTLRDLLATKTKNLFKRLKNSQWYHQTTQEEFWALKDISFEISQGERIGIIGRNGAGKSTLLKILSRITEPTTGMVEINGRVASLLEVGTGFHPELTGRENIFLNGVILGMTRAEIKRKFDDIVAFAEVEKFLDTPVKRYSSGMFVRLAFAVAAHLDPHILIVDEVLAVGDIAFQKKCLGKMEEVSKSGRTVLFVSHNIAAIENLCQKAILLGAGQILKQGSATEVVSFYQASFNIQNAETWEKQPPGDEPVYLKKAHLHLYGEQPHYKIRLKCLIASQAPHKNAFLAFDISNSMGAPIMQAIPEFNPFIKFSAQEQEIITEIELPPLIPDQYRVSIWLGSHNTETICWEKEIVGFEICDSPAKGRCFPHSHNNGFIVPQSHLIYE